MLKDVDLLCDNVSTHGLDEFAQAFFQAGGIENWHERESSNYVEGRYFRGYLDNDTKFSIAIMDEINNRDLAFWVAVTYNNADEVLCDEIDYVLREKLVSAGFRIALMKNFGTHDEQRIDL